MELEDTFSGERPQFILGDETFACSKILLTPFQEDLVHCDARKKYMAHERVCLSAEHSFGLLKNQSRFLMGCLKNVLALISTAVILKNLEIDFGKNEGAVDGEEYLSVLGSTSGQVINMFTMNEDFFWRNKIVSEVFQ